MTSHTERAADVVVVGAGVIGLAIAWQAAERGLDVLVLDRDRAGHGTSHVAAGMIAPIAEVEPHEEPLLELGLRCARAYPEFVERLTGAAGGADVGYRRCGTLVLARDRDEAEALERSRELRRRYGLEPRRLRGSEARALEPALAPTLRLALEVPDDHAIDPRKLTAALAQAVARGPGRLREGAEVVSLLVGPERVEGVRLSSGEEIAAPRVVLAAGVWSGALEGLPSDAVVPVRPVKGQILRLHDPAGPGLLDRVVRYTDGYIVPRGDGRYVIGATMEERGFDTTVTAGAVFELLRDAGELVPGVSELVLDEASAGLRPATPDNVPAIGPAGVKGLYWAAGHRRGGILLAPVTAEAVAEMLTGGEPSLPAALDPGRFARAASPVSGSVA